MHTNRPLLALAPQVAVEYHRRCAAHAAEQARHHAELADLVGADLGQSDAPAPAPSIAPDAPYTIKQACALLGGIHRATLHKLTNEGQITAYSIGTRKTMYRYADLMGLLQKKEPATDGRRTQPRKKYTKKA